MSGQIETILNALLLNASELQHTAELSPALFDEQNKLLDTLFEELLPQREEILHDLKQRGV